MMQLYFDVNGLYIYIRWQAPGVVLEDTQLVECSIVTSN